MVEEGLTGEAAQATASSWLDRDADRNSRRTLTDGFNPLVTQGDEVLRTQELDLVSSALENKDSLTAKARELCDQVVLVERFIGPKTDQKVRKLWEDVKRQSQSLEENLSEFKRREQMIQAEDLKIDQSEMSTTDVMQIRRDLTTQLQNMLASSVLTIQTSVNLVEYSLRTLKKMLGVD